MTDWLLNPDVAYLNHGAFGAQPEVVGEAAADLRAMMERDPADLMMRRLPGMLDDVRARMAALLHADSAGCVFVPNTTAGTATIIASLAPTWEAGDEILATDHRYSAVAVQLAAVAANKGIRAVFAHVPLDTQSAADVVTAITERITERTKLIIVDSIASASGFVFPVAEIVATAHEFGLPVLVDAAHAPGQIEVDLDAISADFWVGNMHKWICSPRAAGIMSVAAEWRDVVQPLVPSHLYAQGFQPAFDWTGTFDPVNLLAVPAALDFWEDLGWANVRRRQRSLVDDGAARVAAALGTTAPVADEFRAGMRVIELPRSLVPEQARAIEETLSQKHRVEISLMPLHHKHFVRVCGQIYNTAADYDRLAAALPDLLETE
ncbi:MAG TPA: aminotransferase class V-fold PLP-dependent enzyme [Mycobacteriales bacterium]|nr:aminotransferase class V-fold PLP-dependent enzyme [Mycobacteriales bacterium]